MSLVIDGRTLTTVEIAPDGKAIRINVADCQGLDAGLSLPTEAQQSLIMTLPAVMERALRLQHLNDDLRLVYPLDRWKIERAEGEDRYILTLRVEDGFAVSFAVNEAHITDMAEALTAGGATPPADWQLLIN
jgi:hypothetical protein